jgi:hypothetical protein
MNSGDTILNEGSSLKFGLISAYVQTARESELRAQSIAGEITMVSPEYEDDEEKLSKVVDYKDRQATSNNIKVFAQFLSF